MFIKTSRFNNSTTVLTIHKSNDQQKQLKLIIKSKLSAQCTVQLLKLS